MTSKPIVCTLKSPHTLNIGESEFKSGCSVIDITFPNMGVVDIGSIIFRNNYTAYLSLMCKVKVQSRGGENQVVWKKAMNNMVLMTNPHKEKCAQTLFCINSPDLRYPLENVSMLRFVLKQPSPCWKSFGLDEIKLLPRIIENKLSNSIPSWLLVGDSHKNVLDDEEILSKVEIRKNGLPDPTEVSKSMYQLWNLSEKSSEVGSVVTRDTTVGRFDIDGCYEINLLSYA